MTEVLIAGDRAELTALASDWIAREIRLAVSERGHASVALAGGSTPQPIHARLAELDLPWEHVTIFFGDERCVAADDPESNFGQAARSLFDPLGPRRPRVQRMQGEDPDRSAAARRYAEELPASLDLLILGIGDDGHTASLFPGSPALDETEQRVLPVIGPKPPPERLTITPPVIEAARAVLMIGAGMAKARAAHDALQGADAVRETPAQLARRGTWILDRDAASELSDEATHGKPS
ncbi:MAG: 6-phosphogluconolactonase [Chlamydiales bacterium]